MTSSSPSGLVLAAEERDAIIQELRRQNEAMVAELRNRMEDEMSSAMGKLLEQFQQLYQTTASPARSGDLGLDEGIVPVSFPTATEDRAERLHVRAEVEASENSLSIRTSASNTHSPQLRREYAISLPRPPLQQGETLVHRPPRSPAAAGTFRAMHWSSIQERFSEHLKSKKTDEAPRYGHNRIKDQLMAGGDAGVGLDSAKEIPISLLASEPTKGRLPSSVERLIKKSEFLLRDRQVQRRGNRRKAVDGIDSLKQPHYRSGVKSKTMVLDASMSDVSPPSLSTPSSNEVERIESARFTSYKLTGDSSSSRYDIKPVDSLSSTSLDEEIKSEGGLSSALEATRTIERRSKHVVAEKTTQEIKTHSDWENNIARHILSVYASSISVIDKITSQATLEFVEGHASSSDLLKLASNPHSALMPSSEESGGTWSKIPVSGKFHVEHYARIRGGGGRVVVIRSPPKCFPIWYSASQDVFFDWSVACTDDLKGQKFQAHLNSLREGKRYMEYLKTVQTVIEIAWDELIATQNDFERVKQVQPSGFANLSSATMNSPISRTVCTASKYSSKLSEGERRPLNITVDASAGRALSKQQIKHFWVQLVLCANAFATLCIEAGESDTSLLIIDLIESWVSRDFLFSSKFRFEVKCYVYFTLAHYFFRNTKYSACLSNTIKGTDLARRRGDIDLVAIGNLRMSCAYLQRGEFVKAHECLYVVLAMIEDGSLAMKDATPERLCLVSLTYHNLAITQLKLLCPEDAIKNSFNAQRIARLCLSMSNRWLPMMHWTHQICLNEIEYDFRQSDIIPPDKRQNVEKLMEMMYTTKLLW